MRRREEDGERSTRYSKDELRLFAHTHTHTLVTQSVYEMAGTFVKSEQQTVSFSKSEPSYFIAIPILALEFLAIIT